MFPTIRYALPRLCLFEYASTSQDILGLENIQSHNKHNGRSPEPQTTASHDGIFGIEKSSVAYPGNQRWIGECFPWSGPGPDNGDLCTMGSRIAATDCQGRGYRCSELRQQASWVPGFHKCRCCRYEATKSCCFNVVVVWSMVTPPCHVRRHWISAIAHTVYYYGAIIAGSEAMQDHVESASAV